jgi:hypothetical protein
MVVRLTAMLRGDARGPGSSRKHLHDRGGPSRKTPTSKKRESLDPTLGHPNSHGGFREHLPFFFDAESYARLDIAVVSHRVGLSISLDE